MMFIRGVKKNEIEFHDQDSYLSKIPAISALKSLEFQKPVTFLVGENGSGKSTLLEAIAVNYGFNAEGGSRNFNFTTEDTHSEFYKSLTLVKGPYRARDGFFLRAESFYNMATEINKLAKEPGGSYNSYGGKSLHCQSHGESFLALVQNRFGGKGVYILDEPEAALSPARQLSLIALIHQLVLKDSQLIIATHSPILMAYPLSEILFLSEGGIEKTEYEQTEHYQVTRDFLENPGRMLDILME